MSVENNEPEITTTHAGRGAGEPRLLIATDDDLFIEGEPEVVDITKEITLIGSSQSADVFLEHADANHAEIRHTDTDEYVLILYGEANTSSYPNTELPNGLDGYMMRTGFSFTIGSKALTFARDEFADHGRPFGGRQGGEFSKQQQQEPRPGNNPPPLIYEVEEEIE